MIKTCRLLIPAREEKSMQEVIDEALKELNMTMDDIKFKNKFHGNDVKATHYGNWVLTPVLDNDKTEKLAHYLNTKTDFHRGILENEDVEKITIGQKVTVKTSNWLAMACDCLGTVHKITKKHMDAWTFNEEHEIPGYDYYEIIIKKKGSHKYGWSFKTGDECVLINGWEVQP